MMSIFTIILFFIYMWGLGFTVSSLIQNVQHSFEFHIMNLGIGLGVFAVLSIILNLVRIPLDWKFFLIISIIYPIYYFSKNKVNFSIKLTKEKVFLVGVLIIFLFTLYTYSGTFNYPYLEDTDPWGHSIGVKYVALEKTAFDPHLEGYPPNVVLSYVDPYPPAYDVLLGILHQTSPDIMWTMKFFTILLISLGVFFFYFFIRRFVGDSKKALLATFIFAALPSYLSHFLWAHALVITLFFPLLYSFEKIRKNPKWWIIGAIMFAAVWVSQNLSQPIKITTLLFIYIFVISVSKGKLSKHIAKGFIGGLVLAQVWWSVAIYKYGFSGLMKLTVGGEASSGVKVGEAHLSLFDTISNKIMSILSSLTNPGGTGSRAYGFDDFFYAKGQNMINNPIGIGVFVSILTIFGIGYIIWKYKSQILNKENTYLAVALFWLIFTFWGVNGQTFPISIARGPFRVWMLLVIPISIIAMEGFYAILTFFKSKSLRNLIIIILLVGIFMTSATAKFELNHAMWPTSGFSGGHPSTPFKYGDWFGTLEPNTAVFLYSPRDKLTIGYGAFSCIWCKEVLDFRKDQLDKDVEQLYSFLKSQKYEYLVLNPGMDAHYLGRNNKLDLLQQRYDEILQSNLFIPIHQEKDVFFVLKPR